MTNQNNTRAPAHEAVLTDDEIRDIEERAEFTWHIPRAVERAVLSKLRAPVADERELHAAAQAFYEASKTVVRFAVESLDDRDALVAASVRLRAALASTPVAMIDTAKLAQLLDSVNGDCYLGKEKEEDLVQSLRSQLRARVAEPEWIDDPHDIEQGMMRNPKYVAPGHKPVDTSSGHSAPVADESPMAKMADALREKARKEQQAYQDRRNQATEWGPMPEGTEADRPISIAPVAHVAGDETSRYLEWAKDRSAWEMPVGTPVYYSALASAPVAGEAIYYAVLHGRALYGIFGSEAAAEACKEQAHPDAPLSVKPLYAAPQASAEDVDLPGIDADRLRTIAASGSHTAMANALLNVARALKQPQAAQDARPCSCPSGDGSLRHPCAVHPPKDNQ